MILGLPIVLGIGRQIVAKDTSDRKMAYLVATIFVVFVLATLKRVADVTQVMQLGRYYLPVFAIALPSALPESWVGSTVSPTAGASVGFWLSPGVRSFGPTRPGPTTCLGCGTDFSFTGLASWKQVTGSEPTRIRFRRTHGSWLGFPGSCASRRTGRPF